MAGIQEGESGTQAALPRLRRRFRKELTKAVSKASGGMKERRGTARSRLTACAFAFALGGIGPAQAQMQLPGATNGVAKGAAPRAAADGSSASGEAPYTPPKPVPVKPPGDDTIDAKSLRQNGHRGAMSFALSGTDLTLTKLTLIGDKISKSNETCSVAVALPKPIVVTPAGHPSGATRYNVPIAACPFVVDVLDGAVLVSRPDSTCSFAAADCLVTPGGLWGPSAAEIPPARIKDLERQRVRIEATMRANFRATLKKAGRDRAAIKMIAGEQAAFSSEREVTCRDYDGESVHGFCSTQIAEARALALVAKFEAIAEGPHEGRRAARAKRRPAPAPPADAQDAAQGEAQPPR